MKTLLIVGGTGFFGKSIIDYFSSANTNKFNIKEIITISRKRIFFSCKNIKLKNLFQDIREIKKIPETDYVIYAATSKNNLENINNLKKFISLVKKNSNKPKVLYASSGAVYGKNDKISSFSEKKKINFKSINKFSNYKKDYAKSKVKMENIFKKLSKYNYNISIARCFTFIGKHILKDKSYAISSIFNDALNKEAIFLNSKNSIYRSYLHADDLTFWLLKIMFYSNKKCPIFNLGSDEYVSIDKVAKIVGRYFNKEIIYQNLDEKNQIDAYLPNIDKAKSYLKLKISLNLKKAIYKVIRDLNL